MATKKTAPVNDNQQVTLTPELEELVSMLPDIKGLCESLIELQDVAENSEEIMEMAKWWRFRNSSKQKPDDVFLPEIKMLMPDILGVIHAWRTGLFEPPLHAEGISIKKYTGDYRTSIRLYPDVWGRWKQFCSLLPAYTEKDLMATALVEFMDKHFPSMKSSIEARFIADTVAKTGMTTDDVIRYLKSSHTSYDVKEMLIGTDATKDINILLEIAKLSVEQQRKVGEKAKNGEVKTVDDVKRIAESE